MPVKRPSGRSSGRGPHAARRLARELALQGLYPALLAGQLLAQTDEVLREQDSYARCDREHLDALLHGVLRERSALEAHLLRHLDRPLGQLSPVEHAALLIGVFELSHCVDIPYRVVINEAVELTKSFGGTDGHRFVNGVLDKLAPALRQHEDVARRRAP